MCVSSSKLKRSLAIHQLLHLFCESSGHGSRNRIAILIRLGGWPRIAIFPVQSREDSVQPSCLERGQFQNAVFGKPVAHVPLSAFSRFCFAASSRQRKHVSRRGFPAWFLWRSSNR